MGGYIGSIGKYTILMGDYVFDYVKRSKPLEYYKNYKIKCEFRNDITHEYEDVEYPLHLFGEIKKLKKYYEFIPDFNLEKILWDELIKREIEIIGYVYVTVFVSGGYFADDVWNYYFLQTPINGDLVELSNKNSQKYNIKKYEDFKWLHKHGLQFSQKLPK